jgi:hypothetical protein
MPQKVRFAIESHCSEWQNIKKTKNTSILLAISEKVLYNVRDILTLLFPEKALLKHQGDRQPTEDSTMVLCGYLSIISAVLFLIVMAEKVLSRWIDSEYCRKKEMF